MSALYMRSNGRGLTRGVRWGKVTVSEDGRSIEDSAGSTYYYPENDYLNDWELPMGYDRTDGIWFERERMTARLGVLADGLRWKVCVDSVNKTMGLIVIDTRSDTPVAESVSVSMPLDVDTYWSVLWALAEGMKKECVPTYNPLVGG